MLGIDARRAMVECAAVKCDTPVFAKVWIDATTDPLTGEVIPQTVLYDDKTEASMASAEIGSWDWLFPDVTFHAKVTIPSLDGWALNGFPCSCSGCTGGAAKAENYMGFK